MKPTVVGIACLVSGIAGFGVGAWLTWSHGGHGDTVSATLVNQSGTAVARAVIRFQSCNLDGIAIAGKLASGQKRTVRYSLCGEGSYSVEVELANGRILRSDGGYVERGYRTEEVIQADRIVTSQALY